MMVHLLAFFPPRYVDTDDPKYNEISQKVAKEKFKDIFTEVNRTIDRVSRNLPHAAEENREEEFDMLLEKIRADRGVDFTQYHRNILKRRIAPRLHANNVRSYAEYLEVLARKPEEYAALYDVFTINVSSFFRDPPVWRGIKTILKSVIRECNEKNEPVRIWSAGCAQGQEPYSLAILALELDDIRVPFKIIATDIDRQSLEKARKGEYAAYDMTKAMKYLTKDLFVIDLEKYFDVCGELWRVQARVKKMIEFGTLNLISDKTIEDPHIILCRNVFIYFTKPLQERIVDKFYRSLRPEGYFVIGNTETLVTEAKPVFREIDAMNRIYQKIMVH